MKPEEEGEESKTENISIKLMFRFPLLYFAERESTSAKDERGWEVFIDGGIGTQRVLCVARHGQWHQKCLRNNTETSFLVNLPPHLMLSFSVTFLHRESDTNGLLQCRVPSEVVSKTSTTR
jgi:hypothetical protein